MSRKKSDIAKHSANQSQTCGTEAPEEFGGRPTGTGKSATSSVSTGTSASGKTEPHIVPKLFWSFFKIGVFTFGGGYAMIPLIQREVTDKRKWVDANRFLELLTLAQSAPGPISLNTAVFVGYNLAGYKGATAAILGTIMPSFIIILLIAMYFTDIKDNHAIEAIFKGMRPAVVALIVAPLFGFTKGMGAYRIGIAILVAAAIWKLSFSPAWFILIGAAGGIIWTYYRKRKEAHK
jgi:chromate transporter